jgi:hypothetical protein
MNKARKKRTGSVMALALIAVLFLFLMGLGLLSIGMQSRITSVRKTSEIAARCAADAGLVKGIYELNEALKTARELNIEGWDVNSFPKVKNQSLPGSSATYSYSLENAPGNGSYVIRSVGTSGQRQKETDATLRLKGLFDYAIFTNGNIELKMGTTVDQYNNDMGGENFKMGTNGTTAGSVTSKMGVTINGDVAVGPGGNPENAINSKYEATITGNTYSMTEERQLDPITVPGWLNALPSEGTINSNRTITTSGKYDSISLVGLGDEVLIDGDVTLYVIGDFRLGNGDELRIVDADTNPNASLTVYLGGNFFADQGSWVNSVTKDAKKLTVYGLNSCKTIGLRNGADFYGAIYAPGANIRVDNGTAIYGAVVGRSFVQVTAGSFNYDASLQEVSLYDEGAVFAIDKWSE